MREPFIPIEIVKYLEDIYTVSEMLRLTKDENSDVSIGFMKGTSDIIDRLKILATREVGD